MRVDRRYLEKYGARRATWDEVIDNGSPLPAVSTSCADRWRTSGKDSRLDWSRAQFLCLNALKGRGFRPQGIGGSATTKQYSIGGDPAAERNLVLTSWYSRAREPGLFAPNHSGGIVTRLVVMDLDRRRYTTVELVKPDARGGFRALNSHGSGLVWAGQYLYSSSRSALWMYNADDLLEIEGRLVLPAVARWTVRGRGGLSSISIDRSANPNQLKAITYAKDASTYVQSFDLARSGLLAENGARSANGLSVANEFGERGRVVHSDRPLAISGTSYQGVGSAGPYTFANSSSLTTSGQSGERADAIAVYKDGEFVEQYQMPWGNGQSVYVDYQRDRYLSITERGSRFLFALPLRQLTAKAER